MYVYTHDVGHMIRYIQWRPIKLQIKRKMRLFDFSSSPESPFSFQFSDFHNYKR